MRRMWLAASAALLACALVGVLLGAYLHEITLRTGPPNSPDDPTVTTTVSTTVSTVTVVVTPTPEARPRQVADRGEPEHRQRPHPTVTTTTTRQPHPPDHHDAGPPPPRMPTCVSVGQSGHACVVPGNGDPNGDSAVGF